MNRRRPKAEKPPSLSRDPRASFEVEDGRAAVLDLLRHLHKAWPEEAAINLRARTCSEIVALLGMPAPSVREALARLDSAGAIEQAPRRRSVGGSSEACWAAVPPVRFIAARHARRNRRAF